VQGSNPTDTEADERFRIGCTTVVIWLSSQLFSYLNGCRVRSRLLQFHLKRLEQLLRISSGLTSENRRSLSPPSKSTVTFPNTQNEFRKLLKPYKRLLKDVLVVLKTTGGYERLFLFELTKLKTIQRANTHLILSFIKTSR
jgi:hypothetical protein